MRSIEGIESSTEKEIPDWMTIQVAKGGGIALLGNVVGKIINLVLHILLGRVLGPGSYGIYALGTSIISISRSFSLLGLKKGVVRFCAKFRGENDNARIKGTILSALLLSLISSAIMAAILFAFSHLIAQKFFHEPSLTWVLRVFAIGIPFYVLMEVTSSFAQSFRRIDYQQGVENIFPSFINLALVSLAFILGFKLYGAVGGFVISGIISAGLGFHFLRRIFPQFRSRLMPISNAKQLLRFSIPTLFLGLSYLLMTYTDRIMLGYFGNASDVGIYNAAAQLGLKATIFLNAIILIYSPMVSDLYNRKMYKDLDKLFKIATKWATMLSLPFLLFLAIFSKSLMMLFGSSFEAGATVLSIIALAQLFNVGTGPLGPLLQMTGKQDIDFVNGITVLILNIGFNIWLIPTFGAIGAAMALGVSIIIFHAARLIEVYILLKIFPYDNRYLKPLIAGTVATLISIAFRVLVDIDQWYLLAISGFFLLLSGYLIVLLAMGLDKEDKVVLYKFKEKISLVLGKSRISKT